MAARLSVTAWFSQAESGIGKVEQCVGVAERSLASHENRPFFFLGRAAMALKLKKYDVVIELLEDLLGTVPKDRAVFSSYIQTKAREMMEKDAKKGVPLASGEEATEESIGTALAEEPETIEDVEEKGWTGQRAA